ncbi:hypothetical protein NKK48_00495 [Mesorhizobium sp. C386A]|uniref:hypothetical protein n=1 Tax=unclassified Mesorhizobium TaxID=325217 RepID=UPI0003CF552F|nr:hypothetical protein [Mesorhizobium sp. LNJC386A00]ESY27420.1 hypothetical protein X748_30315 [Mesorhizobium sp. LNJC386A00]
MIDKVLRSDRAKALAFISAMLSELNQIAGSHRLQFLGYLLEMAYIESYDMVRKERSHHQSKAIDQG